MKQQYQKELDLRNQKKNPLISYTECIKKNRLNRRKKRKLECDFWDT